MGESELERQLRRAAAEGRRYWKIFEVKCRKAREACRAFLTEHRQWAERYLLREMLCMVAVSCVIAAGVSEAGAKQAAQPAEIFRAVSAHKAAAVMEKEIPAYDRASPEPQNSSQLGTLKYGRHAAVRAVSEHWYEIRYKGEKAYIRQQGTVLYNYRKEHIALTFDDGPSRLTTPEVLKALEKNECRATFFVLGNRINRSTAGILRKERALGCEIGNHSYDHAFLVGKSRKKISREFRRTDRLVRRITGQTPDLCRAPYGAFNKKILQIMNRPNLFWTLDTQDWKYRSRRHLMKYVRRQKRDGAVVLMHDIQPSTAKSVDALCRYLKKNNYETVTVSELAAIKNVKLKPGHVYSYIK